jgi:hypothetical protein
MKQIILATAILVGGSLPASAQMTCSSDIAGLALEAVDSVISVFFGGRASQSAQAVQIREAIVANFCAASMNDNLIEMNEMDIRNNSIGSADGIPGINGMIGETSPWMGQAGFLTPEQEIIQLYGSLYPNDQKPISTWDLMEINRQMQVHSRQADLNAAAIQNNTVDQQQQSLKRAGGYAQAAHGDPGIRAEIQATNAILGEQIGATNALTNATVASQRAEMEQRRQDEARKDAANAAASEWMAGIAKCSDCTRTHSFFAN